jgi:hypothetical protein
MGLHPRPAPAWERYEVGPSLLFRSKRLACSERCTLDLPGFKNLEGLSIDMFLVLAGASTTAFPRRSVGAWERYALSSSPFVLYLPHQSRHVDDQRHFAAAQDGKSADAFFLVPTRRVGMPSRRAAPRVTGNVAYTGAARPALHSHVARGNAVCLNICV